MPFRDPDKRREYGREWMRRNAEKARAAMQRWRQRHPEAHRAENAAYYARHAERLKQRIAEYHRALRLAADGAFTSEEWTALMREYGSRCAYCGADAPLEPDHRVALSRGGSNRIENILPACRRCNARKHALTEAEFRARLAAENDGRPRAS